MDPLSMIGSLGGSIIGMIGQNNATRKQISAQKAENAKTRQYNLMLARMQNKWNLQQWQRENDYNSPSAQMARFREAGLNPDLMYGNGTAGNSMGSPALTSGAPATPQDMSPLGGMRNFGDVIQNTLNQEMQRAQIEAIKANTNKTKEETTGVILANENLTYKNLVDAATTGQKIEMENLNVRLAKNALDIGAKNLEKLGKELTTLDQTIEQNKEQLKILQNAVAGGALDNELKRKEVDNYMVKLNNELLNDETMRKYQKAMTAKQWQEFEQDSLKFQKVLLGLDLENGLKVQQGRINALNIRYKKAETGMLEFEFDDASRKHRLKNQPVNSVSDFTGLFVDYMNYISNKIVIDAPDAVIKFFTKGK
jgi:hypothetical protein